ncbi:MAG: imidazoleglycerol-phosphate dehydratase HisB [Armatimonadetes bacterium]|nr:imidazoleglycerol-phosphate dehydratase HisB [Armatimonadota bacterium]
MKEPRKATVQRKTNETEILLAVSLDGSGDCEASTGIGFFDHMLQHIAKHGGIDLKVKATGDLHVDDHHLVEDVGICLGRAISQALGDRRGIQRFGDAVIPMDEALILCAMDFSGRGLLVENIETPATRIGGFSAEMLPEFFRAVASNAGLTLHLRQLAGRNSHHIVEGAFKAFARALKDAVKVTDDGGIPSTKGVIESQG